MTKAFAVLLIFGAFAGTALAAPIASGGTAATTLFGNTPVYQIFGHPGNPGGDVSGGSVNDAVLFTFAAGAGNVFTFTASGLVNCCGGTPNTPPDGLFAGTSIMGANGLSSVAGNTQLPLLGVFTTDTDPFGSTPPATLSWDANNPTSLSPLLQQVFYIGDGKTGYQDATGSPLAFAAPASATRLYLGVADAFGFNGLTAAYADNTGSYAVTVSLAAVPEPQTYAMMIVGLALLGLVGWDRLARPARESLN